MKRASTSVRYGEHKGGCRCRRPKINPAAVLNGIAAVFHFQYATGRSKHYGLGLVNIAAGRFNNTERRTARAKLCDINLTGYQNGIRRSSHGDVVHDGERCKGVGSGQQLQAVFAAIDLYLAVVFQHNLPCKRIVAVVVDIVILRHGRPATYNKVGLKGYFGLVGCKIVDVSLVYSYADTLAVERRYDKLRPLISFGRPGHKDFGAPD